MSMDLQIAQLCDTLVFLLCFIMELLLLLPNKTLFSVSSSFQLPFND